MSSLARVRVRIARVIAGSLTVAALLSGCAAGDQSASGPQADPASSSASSSAATSTGEDASSSPTGASTAPAASCSVRGFTPRTHITALHARPVVVYGILYTLAPSGTVRSSSYPADRIDDVPIRLRSSSDTPLSPVDRDQILGSDNGPVHHGAIKQQVSFPLHLHNGTRHNRAYLVYRGGLAWSGRWSKTVCGGPYNDGSSVERLTGTYRTLGSVGPPRVAVCGQVPPQAGALARHAAKRACA